MKKNLLLSTGALCAFTLSCYAQVPFSPLDTNFSTKTVIIPPSPLKYDVLFVGNHDYVSINGGTDSALAKQNHDFTGYIPSSNGKNRGWIIVNHEITNTKNPKLGDGGGQTSFMVRKRGATRSWEVVPTIGGKKFHNVDFSKVGGTNTNCGGAHTPYGTTLTAEEFPQNSNLSLWANGTGIQDTSDYKIPAGNGPYSGKTIKRWQNYGWMVEADPKSAKGLRKLYSMGRYGHEGGYCLEDGKTVFLTDDNTPGVFFKFVADKVNNYTTGQLYAYKQNSDGIGGSWISLPRELDSLMIIRDIALKKGATTFTRLEWVELAGNGKFYITETGADLANHSGGVAAGGSLAYHNTLRDTMGGQPKDFKFTDYYGRVLEFDMNTNHMRVYLEGGNGTDIRTNLSGPDGLASVTIDGVNYLVINEDLTGSSQNRMPAGPNNGKNICEIYFVDLSITNPTVDNISRFIIGPVGAETTGGKFTPDGNTYFVNIQHPSSSNTFPFNNSTTIAVTGFKSYIQANKSATTEATFSSEKQSTVATTSNNTEVFTIYPNPASRELYFNKTTDIAIYDTKGSIVKVERNVKSVDISNLESGIYYVQTISGEVQKLVIE